MPQIFPSPKNSDHQDFSYSQDKLDPNLKSQIPSNTKVTTSKFKFLNSKPIIAEERISLTELLAPRFEAQSSAIMSLDKTNLQSSQDPKQFEQPASVLYNKHVSNRSPPVPRKRTIFGVRSMEQVLTTSDLNGANIEKAALFLNVHVKRNWESESKISIPRKCMEQASKTPGLKIRYMKEINSNDTKGSVVEIRRWNRNSKTSFSRIQESKVNMVRARSQSDVAVRSSIQLKEGGLSGGILESKVENNFIGPVSFGKKRIGYSSNFQNGRKHEEALEPPIIDSENFEQGTQLKSHTASEKMIRLPIDYDSSFACNKRDSLSAEITSPLMSPGDDCKWGGNETPKLQSIPKSARLQIESAHRDQISGPTPVSFLFTTRVKRHRNVEDLNENIRPLINTSLKRNYANPPPIKLPRHIQNDSNILQPPTERPFTTPDYLNKGSPKVFPRSLKYLPKAFSSDTSTPNTTDKHPFGRPDSKPKVLPRSSKYLPKLFLTPRVVHSTQTSQASVFLSKNTQIHTSEEFYDKLRNILAFNMEGNNQMPGTDQEVSEEQSRERCTSSQSNEQGGGDKKETDADDFNAERRRADMLENEIKRRVKSKGKKDPRYAVVRISDFDTHRTYEIMKTSKTTPNWKSMDLAKEIFFVKKSKMKNPSSDEILKN